MTDMCKEMKKSQLDCVDVVSCGVGGGGGVGFAERSWRVDGFCPPLIPNFPHQASRGNGFSWGVR